MYYLVSGRSYNVCVRDLVESVGIFAVVFATSNFQDGIVHDMETTPIRPATIIMTAKASSRLEEPVRQDEWVMNREG